MTRTMNARRSFHDGDVWVACEPTTTRTVQMTIEITVEILASVSGERIEILSAITADPEILAQCHVTLTAAQREMARELLSNEDRGEVET